MSNPLEEKDTEKISRLKNQNLWKIQALIDAIESCGGVPLPYPTAKKMSEVWNELKAYLKES